MFADDLCVAAERLLAELRASRLRLVTAESCTGGLIAGLLTEIAGSSDVLERGYVTYSNNAKIDCLGVPPALLAEHGAVSHQVACAMAVGALRRSNADIAIAVTGVAGPGGGTADKPVGLVHMAAVMAGGKPVGAELRLGDIGRSQVRLETVRQALKLVDAILVSRPSAMALQ